MHSSPPTGKYVEFHAFNHLIDALQDTIGVEYLKGILFKMSHKRFKKDYALLSNWRATVTDENLNSSMERALKKLSTFRWTRNAERKLRNRAICEGSDYLVQGCGKKLILKLERGRVILYCQRKKCKVESQVDVSNHILHRFLSIDEAGLRVSMKLLKENLTEIGMENDEKLTCMIQLPALMFVCGRVVPQLGWWDSWKLGISGKRVYTLLTKSRYQS